MARIFKALAAARATSGHQRRAEPHRIQRRTAQWQWPKHYESHPSSDKACFFCHIWVFSTQALPHHGRSCHTKSLAWRKSQGRDIDCCLVCRINSRSQPCYGTGEEHLPSLSKNCSMAEGNPILIKRSKRFLSMR